MNPVETSLSEEAIKRRAYMLGMQMKNSGMDQDVIYAKLEKQGIPMELAKQVAEDISIERRKDTAKQEQPFYYLAWLKIGLGVGAAILSLIILPGNIIVPIGLIGSGIISALLHKKKV